MRFLVTAIAAGLSLFSLPAFAAQKEFIGGFKIGGKDYSVRLQYETGVSQWTTVTVFDASNVQLASCDLSRRTLDPFVHGNDAKLIQSSYYSSPSCKLEFFDANSKSGEISLRLSSYGIFSSEVGYYAPSVVNIVRTLGGHDYSFQMLTTSFLEK